MPGRSGRVDTDWLAERKPAWRAQITVAALDPFRGDATALPDAVRVLDTFHVVRLGVACVDEVRRRVQQRPCAAADTATTRCTASGGCRADRLSVHARRRLETELTLGEPASEVAVTWWLAQDLCARYRRDSPDTTRRDLDRLLAQMTSCPVPEVARLGRTLASWRAKLLAYWRTSGASNSPTEAMNLLIEKTRRSGHGHRNFTNNKLQLLLHSGTG